VIARIIVFAVFIAVAHAAAGDTLDDYAYRIPLVAEGDRAFFAVEMPVDVYHGTVRADLGDVRVFNDNGTPVAHAFLPQPAPAREAAGAASLPFFPLRIDEARNSLAGLSIRLRKDGAATSVDLATQDGEIVPAQRLAGYLIDATALKQPVVALTLPFASATNVTTRVNVDASDDLVAWRSLASEAPLVDLEFAGRKLVRNRIEVRRTSAKYLRLTWPGGQPTPDFAGVMAEFGERLVEAPREWRSIPGAAVAGKPGEFEYDFDGVFPADRMTLYLAELNTIAPAQLLARASLSEEWHPVASGVFYRLRDARGEIENPELAVDASPRRYWLVRIDPKVTIDTPPRLFAGFHPRVLVFAARGNANYMLAYGSRRAKPAALAIATLIPGYDRATFDPTTLGHAQVGEATATGSRRALREPTDVKRWVLWSVLIVASLVLGWMALRLSREMRERPAERDTD
jgi:hypothetical protein